MTNFLTIAGIIVFVIGGLYKNKVAISIGVALIIIGSFTK
jgi:hypothetical protein